MKKLLRNCLFVSRFEKVKLMVEERPLKGLFNLAKVIGGAIPDAGLRARSSTTEAKCIQ